MKRKIALLLITGICLANTVPCFASPSMKVSVSSSEENQYSTLPDGDTLQKDVGFRPKAPASLAGGYLFGSGNITESFDLDSNGAPVKRTIIPPNPFPCPQNQRQASPFQAMRLL